MDSTSAESQRRFRSIEDKQTGSKDSLEASEPKTASQPVGTTPNKHAASSTSPAKKHKLLRHKKQTKNSSVTSPFNKAQQDN